MDVREAQRHGILALLFLGLVVYGVSVLPPGLFQPQLSRLPWISQRPGMLALEIGGDSGKAGIYFFSSSENLGGVLTSLGLDDILSPECLRDALVNADLAVSLALDQGEAALAELDAVKRLALGLPINLNKASEEDLAWIPGIGSKTASQIITLRQTRGQFRSVAELQALPGIKQRKIESLKGYLITGEGR